MELARPLPSSLSSSQPPLSHRCHRRPAFSGKLLNLFTTKTKDQARPVISHPQPLQTKVPVRPKRVYRDENEPQCLPPRPRSRARFNSNDSVAHYDTVPHSPSPGHTPPRSDRTKPLKSALKKSASENASLPASPGSRLLSSSSLASDTPLKSPKSKVATRVSGGAWMSFSRNHATSASSVARDPRPVSNGARQKKSVSFALEESEPRPSRSKPSRASSSGELSHWDEIAQELDGPATSRPSSILKYKAEDYPEPGRTPVPPRPGSPTVTRKTVFKPESPPTLFRRPLYSTRLTNGESRHHPAGETIYSTDNLVARRIPHTATPYTECARDKIRTPPRNVKALAKAKVMEGAPGVLRRITADIVPTERHSVVWDAGERDTFAWGGTMILRDAKAASYFYPRHYIKDIHLDFCAVPEPRSGLDVAATSIRVSADPDAPPAYDWRTLYTGHSLKRHDVRQELDIVRGIALEPDFVFVKSDDPDGPHAWLVHFWVVVGGYDTPEIVILAACIAAGIESLKSDWFIALAAGVRDGRAEES